MTHSLAVRKAAAKVAVAASEKTGRPVDPRVEKLASVTHSCNCMYGPQDSRCCIARARRNELEEAHRLGREGKPLPPVKETTLTALTWTGSVETRD